MAARLVESGMTCSRFSFFAGSDAIITFLARGIAVLAMTAVKARRQSQSLCVSVVLDAHSRLCIGYVLPWWLSVFRCASEVNSFQFMRLFALSAQFLSGFIYLGLP